MDSQTRMEILDFARSIEDGYRFPRQIIKLNKLKVEELKYFAKENRIQWYYNMRKPKIIEVLRDKGVEISANDLSDFRGEKHSKELKRKLGL